jgi:hypothetical protein
MDYYGTDRKLSELGEQDLDDFLDQDMFTPPASVSTSTCHCVAHIDLRHQATYKHDCAA